jgi:hypothetical protein
VDQNQHSQSQPMAAKNREEKYKPWRPCVHDLAQWLASRDNTDEAICRIVHKGRLCQTKAAAYDKLLVALAKCHFVAP